MAGQKTEGSSKKTKQHAFGHALPHQPAHAGAEGAANRNLTATSHALGQEQVADVRTGNKEDEPDRRKHDQESLANAMANAAEHGDYDIALLDVVRGVRIFESARDGIHFVLRLMQRHAWLNATDHRHEIFAARGLLKIQRSEERRVGKESRS